MTEQDKQLLIRNLCARLPYGVKINTDNDWLLAHQFDFRTVIPIYSDRKLPYVGQYV